MKVIDTAKYELDFDEPPEEIVQWAKEHIGEDPDMKCQEISDFRDMIYAKGECIPHRTDDAFLLRFLRARNFMKERAHRLLVNYCDFKDNNPELFENVDLKKLSTLGDDDIISVPPYREGSGRRILQYRLGRWNPEHFSVDELIQATLFILEAGLLEQRAQILGGIAIFDFEELSMQQAWYLTPSVAHKVIQIMVTSFPMKTHALHIVNQSYVFDVTYNLFKSFINEKMKKRIFFHGSDMESLHKHIDPKYLPKKYGGIHEDYNYYKEWIQIAQKINYVRDELKIMGYTDWIEEEEKSDDTGEQKSSEIANGPSDM